MSVDALIHPSAQIDPSACIDTSVAIGAYSVIGAQVEIGAGTVIGPHVVIDGPTQIGCDNRISQFSSIGNAPQDKKYNGDPTELLIGNRNVIREFVTINRGTSGGGGITRIGNDNLLLAYVHVAHDCQVANHVVFSNYAALAGHVHIDDWVILSGYVGVHQFCKIGAHAFIGLGCLITSDVPPFILMAHQQQSRPRGINIEGLKRRGFDAERIAAIKRAYRTLYVGGRPLSEARSQLGNQVENNPDVRQLMEFLDASERPLPRQLLSKHA